MSNQELTNLNNTVIDSTHGFDWGKALVMRRKQHMSYQAIDDKFGVTKQAVFHALNKIEELLPYEYSKIPDDVVTELKKSLNIMLLLDQADPVKRAEASLNNSYFTQNNIDKQIKLEKGQSTEIHSVIHDIKTLDAEATQEIPKAIDTPDPAVSD